MCFFNTFPNYNSKCEFFSICFLQITNQNVKFCHKLFSNYNSKCKMLSQKFLQITIQNVTFCHKKCLQITIQNVKFCSKAVHNCHFVQLLVFVLSNFLFSQQKSRLFFDDHQPCLFLPSPHHFTKENFRLAIAG